MNKLSTWIKGHFITLILAFTAGGFLFILAELLLERHWGGVQTIAPVSAVLGFILVGLALTGRRGLPVVALLLLLGVTGLFGTLEHFEARTEEHDRPPEASQVALQTLSVTPSTEGEFAGPPDGGRRGGPPWLAPLSLSGLALLGAAATLAGKDEARQVL